jgi:hypothetical protein
VPVCKEILVWSGPADGPLFRLFWRADQPLLVNALLYDPVR